MSQNDPFQRAEKTDVGTAMNAVVTLENVREMDAARVALAPARLDRKRLCQRDSNYTLHKKADGFLHFVCFAVLASDFS